VYLRYRVETLGLGICDGGRPSHLDGCVNFRKSIKLLVNTYLGCRSSWGNGQFAKPAMWYALG